MSSGSANCSSTCAPCGAKIQHVHRHDSISGLPEPVLANTYTAQCRLPPVSDDTMVGTNNTKKGLWDYG